MKRILIIIMVAAAMALVVNDGGRYAQAYIDLRNATRQVLVEAAVRAKGADAAQGRFSDTLAQLAASQQITVTQFSVTPDAVHVWTAEPVPGTWVLAPYVAMSKGVPFKAALKTPLIITYDAEEPVK